MLLLITILPLNSTRFVNKFFTVFLHQPYTKVGRSDLIFNIDCLYRQHVSEWCIPLSLLSKAMNEIKTMIDQHPAWPAHLPIEIRVTASDEIWLSPSFERLSAWVGIITYKPLGYKASKSFQNYFDAFETIMRKYEGRPHWAKQFGLTYSECAQMYPRFGDWIRERNEFDPDQIFVNDYIGQLLNDSEGHGNT